jgi:hypothetical protein
MRKTVMTSIRTSVIAALLGAAALGCGGDDSKPATTNTAALVPPTEFEAAVLNQPAVHLTWKDAPSEHHYTIQRKVGAGEFKKLVDKDPNATAHHDDSEMVKGTTYTYRIASGGPNGELGAWSPEISATLPQ